MATSEEHLPSADIESDFEPHETAVEFGRRRHAALCRGRAALPLLAWAKARLGRTHSDEVSDHRHLR